MGNNIKESNYYVVKSLDLAKAILFVTGEIYYIYDDREDRTKKIYSFKKSDRLLKAIELIFKVKEELSVLAE